MKSAKARTFVESLKKQSCLFGTLHIKAAAAIITLIDLFFICHFDEVLYKNRASDLQYNIAFALILYMLVMVLLAQYALHRNAGWMLLPLILTHIGFCLGSFSIYASQIYAELIFVIKYDIHLGRLFMFILYRIIISILNCYAIFILCRTYVMLKNYSEPMNVTNQVFENVKDVGEIVFFEKPSLTRRHHLVASPALYDSPRGAPTRSPSRPVLLTNVL
uniref:Uncharacterized protein n=1 Tax=Panagrolaimus sp. PS1159 TaxID=55785 RepID=A0AC35GXG7_9BILA